MTRLLVFSLVASLGCQPPPASPSKRVVEIYRHGNGLTNCVDLKGDRWMADKTCCPDGFEAVGYSVPAVTEYKVDDSTQRKLYRHVVCLEQ